MLTLIFPFNNILYVKKLIWSKGLRIQFLHLAVFKLYADLYIHFLFAQQSRYQLPEQQIFQPLLSYQ